MAGPPLTAERVRRWEPVWLALLLLLGAYLRLTNLADNPGWDGDEGYNLNIAANLLAGHAQMFAMRYAFVQHPPFFYVLGAIVMRLWTHDLIALRALSACCGILTILALFGLGTALGGRRLGWAAAVFYAIWPEAVLQVRWAYTYNLLALLVIATLWAALPPVVREETSAFTPGSLMDPPSRGLEPASWPDRERPEGHASRANEPPRPKGRGFLAPIRRSRSAVPALSRPQPAQSRWNLHAPVPLDRSRRPLPSDRTWGYKQTALLAGLCAGLALATDQEAAALIPPLIYLWWRDWRSLMGGLLMTAMAPAIYLGIMLVTRRDDLLFDIHHTASRLNSGPGDLLVRLAHLYSFDPLVVIGLCGLGLAACGRIRTTLAVLAILLTALVLEVRDPAPVFRAGEPLLPLAGLGMGALILWVGRLLVRLVGGSGRPRARAAIVILVLLVPLGGSLLASDLASVRGTFRTGLASTLPRSAAEARRMAAWINARVQPTDLVIAMPGIAWLLHCRTTELLQAAAVSGHGTAFYPDGLSMSRFVYDPRLSAARYLVVDTFTRLWIAEHSQEQALVRRAERAWPVVYRHGEYVIYGHPR